MRIASPSAARKLGIGMVFQHFSLFEALTAAENIALSLDDKTPISTIAAKAQALSYSYGLPLDPYALVGDLSVGERQRIEIIRCLLQTPQLIILDEPTSVLTPQEADKLFETLERLRSRGQVDPLHLAPPRRGEAHVRRARPCCVTARWSATAIRARRPPASLARMMVGSEVQAVVRAPVEGIGAASGAARDPQPRPQAGDAVLDPAARTSTSTSGPAR